MRDMSIALGRTLAPPEVAIHALETQTVSAELCCFAGRPCVWRCWSALGRPAPPCPAPPAIGPAQC